MKRVNLKSLLKCGFVSAITLSALLTGSSSSFAYKYYYSGDTALKMINGTTDGRFTNNATSVIHPASGVTYDMAQTAQGAMSAWNSTTKASCGT